jgi:LuxR family maltose regulon positive regulatory protein
VDSSENLIEPLSQRELEVLSLIAEGISNQEIGLRLHISLSTVKGHTTQIYGKLNVSNRIQAVARARSLGLISFI